MNGQRAAVAFRVQVRSRYHAKRGCLFGAIVIAFVIRVVASPVQRRHSKSADAYLAVQ
jgi:hypothetical protein